MTPASVESKLAAIVEEAGDAATADPALSIVQSAPGHLVFRVEEEVHAVISCDVGPTPDPAVARILVQVELERVPLHLQPFVRGPGARRRIGRVVEEVVKGELGLDERLTGSAPRIDVDPTRPAMSLGSAREAFDRRTRWVIVGCVVLVLAWAVALGGVLESERRNAHLERSGERVVASVTSVDPGEGVLWVTLALVTDGPGPDREVLLPIETDVVVGDSVEMLVDPERGWAKVRGEEYFDELLDNALGLGFFATLLLLPWTVFEIQRQRRIGRSLRSGAFEPIHLTPVPLLRRSGPSLFWVVTDCGSAVLVTPTGFGSLGGSRVEKALRWSSACVGVRSGRRWVVHWPSHGSLTELSTSRFAWRNARWHRLVTAEEVPRT